MAHSAIHNFHLRLPPATVILVLTAILGSAESHALPRQTSTVGLHELNVIAWPPIPTEAPLSPFELLRRQEQNTICGYIGGNSALPATCSAGSHCVLDTQNQVMGCCPNGGACTTGVFTGCVDYNSGPLTEANPYVFTCQGSDVCYKNQFGGGVFQYGCGTASNLAATVQASASGVAAALILPTTSNALTKTPSSLSEPTSINPGTGTRSFSSISRISISVKTSTSGTTSGSSSSVPSSSSSSTSPKTTPSSTSTGTGASASSTSSSPPAAPAAGPTFDRTGAIVGGTISGFAILIALIAIAVFYIQKRRNARYGPGPAPAAPPSTEYMSPMRSHGAAFAPLPTWQEEEEPATPQPAHSQPHGVVGQAVPMYNHYDPVAGNSAYMGAYAESAPVQHHPANFAERTPIADAHMRSSSREIDDFSQGYTTAIGQMQEEDRQPLTVVNPDDQGSDGGSPSRNPDRPLWQQNRRQSRNLMWM